ncbi:hypothetical protein HDU84_008924 [Entophlyctis sp. JEL0112]|nr:hypothetical protein HDU84_008924 [Entophlyctis sp. JEL0112]
MNGESSETPASDAIFEQSGLAEFAEYSDIAGGLMKQLDPDQLGLRPIRRTKVTITYKKIIDTDLPLLVPKILYYVTDEMTLRECLRVNWCFLTAVTARMYQNIYLFGSSGPVLRRLVKLMNYAAERQTMIDYRKCVKNLEASDLVLEEQEVTPFQSWNLFRELVRRTAPTLEKIFLDSTDNGFHDSEIIRGCGLDQRVEFPVLKSFTVGPNSLSFPISFIIDFLQRCHQSTLASIRLPGCIPYVDAALFELIVDRGGKALQDLILTPPLEFSVEDHNRIAYRPTADILGNTENMRNQFLSVESFGKWDFDILCDGLLLVCENCPDLRALDISGNTEGLRPGILEQLLRRCPLLEELDLPCGITDANMSEILLAQPQNLWRICASCNCHKSLATLPGDDNSADNGEPCSLITDMVVRAFVEELLPGRSGALLELPEYVMRVRDARLVATLDALDETVPGIEIDFRDTDVVFVPRLGVRIAVPGGRAVCE